jgi:hypothetical protein
MTDLYKIDKNGKTIELEKFKFANETKDLEDFIMNNEQVIGKVALLNRQITLPNNQRIDVWGIDLDDLRPVIVELKNVICGLEIIPQILPYYQFVKLNPDTIKLKALSDKSFESKLKSTRDNTENIANLIEGDPKIILVAPGFKPELMETIGYLSIDVDIIQISRFKTDHGELIVNIERPISKENTPAVVRTMEDWSWEKYQKIGISKSKCELAHKLYDRLFELNEKHNYNLKPIFRKLYIPFQSGRNNIFWIDLSYTSYENGDITLVFKMDKEFDIASLSPKLEFSKLKWFEKYKQLYVHFNKDVDISSIASLIEESMNYVNER